MKISILIPCYNEEKSINNLRQQLVSLGERFNKIPGKIEHELVFVDDGSTDNTYQLLLKNFPEAKIIQHEKNKNLGAAMRTGFQHCTGDLIFVLDSDCSYAPSVMFEMLNLIEKYDIVTVSPYHEFGSVEGLAFHRLFLSKSVNLFYRIVSGIKIKTFTAMVRLYKREVIENVKFESDGFLAQAELLIKAKFKGYTVAEVPATLKIDPARGSGMKLFSTIMSHFKFLVKVLCWRMSSRF